jgi:hypothetical protein
MEIEGFIHVLYECYKMVPVGDKFKQPVLRYNLEIGNNHNVLEFVLGKSQVFSKNYRELKQVI